MSPSTSGDAALSVPVSPPHNIEVPVPVPLPESVPKPELDQGKDGELKTWTQAHDGPLHNGSGCAVADSQSQEQQAPGRMRLPLSTTTAAAAAGPQDARARVASSTPAAPVSSTETYVAPDLINDKWPRGPASAPVSVSASAVPKRPNGPSLLTQQLAEARGIPPPVTGQFLDLSHSSARIPQSLCDPLPSDRLLPDLASDSGNDTKTPKPPSTDTSLPHLHDDDDDGSSLTPRASPRAIAMATTAAVSTISLPLRTLDTVLPRTLDSSEIPHDVGVSRLGSPRDVFLTGGRGMSLDHPDGDHKPRGLVSTHRTFSDASAASNATTSSFSDPGLSLSGGSRTDVDPATADLKSPTRPRKPDHRVSLGPEKAWSIGADDLNNAQDGQVEKAIAEVLAGVEPNARSRKASHSLRFFKEGLPEASIKKKESRLGLKDKLRATDDVFYDEPVHGDDHTKSLQPSPHTNGDTPGRLKRTKTLPLPIGTNESQPPAKETMEYFQIPPEYRQHPLSPTPSRDQPPRGPISPVHENSTTAAPQQDNGGHESVVTVHVEDGELSGEEKISSAVFVPHKGPQGVPEGVDESEVDMVDAATPSTRSEHGSAWLVKADEPEADEPDTVQVQRDIQVAAIGDQDFLGSTQGVVGEIIQIHTTPEHPKTTGHGVTRDISPQYSQVTSPGYSDHVHDHQVDPNQPLDAIELVPYRHQVGGHTTLWRFSKRAVCKQLNNRENEFYEQIEKNHRDLLPFLPRYIGVLNVTFSKQPRRKSIVKKDATPPFEPKTAKRVEQESTDTNGVAKQETIPSTNENTPQLDSQPRLISQSMQAASESIPTVTFLDNQHILPRSLLQPAVKAAHYLDRGRSSSVSIPASRYLMDEAAPSHIPARPSLEDRHANSWGTTMVNKKLRHEVFSDAFLKQPINVQRRKRAHQRPIPRKTLGRLLRPSSSDQVMSRSDDDIEQLSQSDPSLRMLPRVHQKTQSDLGLSTASSETCVADPNDVTGTSAPEPHILIEAMTPQRKKRRHSGSALRTRPMDVSESRGELRYWEEPDEAGYKGDHEDLSEPAPTVDVPLPPPAQSFNGALEPKDVEQPMALSSYASTVTSVSTSPTSEFKRIPRPVNPKEAQVQRDSRVSYFLLLEDLTAGMKKPCIMDLKMGTRQYGVDATAKKQKSQQRKCAQTTSRELGVRVCGLQVWDAKLEEYVFRDKYYGRSLKAGSEFQEALTRFLYDGKDRSSILRHIPTVLQKLSKLEVIARRLRGYRFYAASLLVTYDGDQSDQDGYDTAIDDSTTDFATDTEEASQVRKRKNKREIDFKIADFANSLTPQDIAKDKSCPPQHPDEPDRGFLKGLRSLRRYFLKIQQDTRAELGLSAAQRNPDYDPELDVSDTESVSE